MRLALTSWRFKHPESSLGLQDMPLRRGRETCPAAARPLPISTLQSHTHLDGVCRSLKSPLESPGYLLKIKQTHSDVKKQLRITVFEHSEALLPPSCSLRVSTHHLCLGSRTGSGGRGGTQRRQARIHHAGLLSPGGPCPSRRDTGCPPRRWPGRK